MTGNQEMGQVAERHVRRTKTAKRRLRMRLALLYSGVLLGSGLVLLVIAVLPLTFVGRAQQARVIGGRLVPVGPTRSLTNLPEVLEYSAIALAVLAVVSLAVGWLVADRSLRPLRAITATARSTSASSLADRVPLAETYEEFQELGDTLNGLFARLEAAFESQRRFVANASHELRTPLAAERAVLQVALADPDADPASLRAACEQVLRLGEQQERLVNALLTLATSQRGLQGSEPFDLAEVTDRAIAGRRGEAERLDVRVTASLGAAVVTGDPALAESLAANLVDNAVRHNVPGGQVWVATGTNAGRPWLSVANTGQVIPQDEVARLLEPFQQFAAERTGRDAGHGLGLAIVAAVADAHGAGLTVLARPEGGLAVTVTFPG
jgi:signal transduction histidine kinase